jgi:hypothetical protein
VHTHSPTRCLPHWVWLTPIALSLSACGGGGGSSSSVTMAPSDSFSYQVSSTPTGGASSTSYSTRTVLTQNGGRSTRADTSSAGSAMQTLSFSSADTQTGSTQGSSVCTRTAGTKGTLTTFPQGDPVQGQTWSYNFVEACATPGALGSSVAVTGSGEILGVESVSTAAATFSSALKYKLGEILVDTEGNVTSRQYTCWRDPNLHLPVRCDYSNAVTDISSASTSVTQISQQLVGIDVADYANPVRTTKRFAGAWTLTVSGQDSGTCTFSVAAAGTISAPSCYSDGSGNYYSLSGSVSNTGTLLATGSNGQVFNGQLSTPLQGAGSWLSSTQAGAWVAVHR